MLGETQIKFNAYMLNVLRFATLLFVLVTFNCYSQTTSLEINDEIIPIRNSKNLDFKGWTNFYFSEEDCKCVYGGEFFVAIKKSAAPTKNLIVSLQGGGACWPGIIQCKPTTSSSDVEKAAFASEVATRSSKDWHQVFIPYCDGSVYMGNATQDYDADGVIDHWHEGLKISLATSSLTKRQFPGISNIFLTGFSAGGYGTILHLRLLRQLYPDASIYVLNESGPGLFRPDADFWKMIKSSWNLDALVPDDCEYCESQMLYWYDEMLKDDKVKIGLFSTYHDEVIGQGFLNMAPDDYKSLLVRSTDHLNSKYPNQFKRFFIQGTSHFIEDRNYKLNGTCYWDWIIGLINEESNWQDLLEE